jgi:hypothetical protein
VLDLLWDILIGSILIVAILFAWVVIYSFVTVAIKQWKRDRHAHD